MHFLSHLHKSVKDNVTKVMWTFILLHVLKALLQEVNKNNYIFKGIVSRDWGELQMIPVDSLEVLVFPRHIFTFF